MEKSSKIEDSGLHTVRIGYADEIEVVRGKHQNLRTKAYDFVGEEVVVPVGNGVAVEPGLET